MPRCNSIFYVRTFPEIFCMSEMEPDTRDFLKRIIQTVSMGMLFMLLHMTFGLYLNWGFFEGAPSVGNIIYYIVFLASLAGLIYYYYRMWKGKL